MSEAKSGGAVSTYTIIGTVDANGKAQAVSAASPIPIGEGAATAGAPEAAVSVTTSATLVQAANTARKEVRFEPTNGTIFWGTDNTVTTSNGIQVASGTVWIEDTWKGAIYAIAAGTVDVRRMELT